MSSLDISAYLPVRGPVEIRGSSFPDLGPVAIFLRPHQMMLLDARLGRDNKSKGSWRIWWATRWKIVGREGW